MIRVGIVGAAGYTAGELIRILVSHPCVELRYLQSGSHRGGTCWLGSSGFDLYGSEIFRFGRDGY